MRKIALISLIAFLDIAFIVLVRGDLQLIQPPLEIAELAPPELQSPNAAEDPLDADESVVSADAEKREGVVERKPVTRQIALSRRGSAGHRSPLATEPAFNPDAANAVNNGFKDTIIWYKRASYVRPQETAVAPELPQEKTEPMARVAPPKRKRSFISRAGTIVTKPYDWLKDLASKFH